MVIMANTLRETTTSCRRGLIPFPSLGWRPHISTAADPICQETGLVAASIAEPVLFSVLRLLELTLELHSMTNGATVSLTAGNMAGRKLFAVSIYPERTIELAAQPSRRQLFAFVLANLDLLLRSNRALGTWFNEQKGVHVLDVVVCLADRNTTIALGQFFRQWSAFDLDAEEEIRIGRPDSLLRPTFAEARQ
jgi:hypothetical protein